MSVIAVLLAALSHGGDAPVDYYNQVVPILIKSGCNAGACHGAAVGRGGFRLSLYGGDPDADYVSIVRELKGRRVNLVRPEDSLLIQKPTESITHGGGGRLEYEGADAELLRRWIAQGAPRQRMRRLRLVRVTPSRHVAQGVDERLQLRAVAEYDDGSRSDVTRWTVFTPEDPSAVVIDPQSAQAELRRRGRHVVVARYLEQVVPLELLVPMSDKPVDLSSQPRMNFIDEHVLELLGTLRLPVSQPADDEAFLRRVTLDLTGRLPSAELQRQYLGAREREAREGEAPAGTREGEELRPVEEPWRTRLVNQLLDSPEFSEYWTLRLAQLLRIRSQPQQQQAAEAYQQWLAAQVAEGRPYDQLARELLTASGDTHRVGPANFYRTVGGPREQAEFASELFMGSRLRCANCHNHPLDRWTQDDYHGLAAIFAKLRRGRVIEPMASGSVTHPRSGEDAVPRIPGEQFLAEPGDGRQALAQWLTRPDNPYFAKAIVNRLWKAMMGRGLVEPTDDLRATNPATHPALLDQLARDFVAHGYDLRHTLRRIALSAAYGRSGAALPGAESDRTFYSHALPRPLPPEVLADALSDVMGLPEPYGKQPPGTRAVALLDGSVQSRSLDVLGRCSREDSCESPAAAGAGGLARQLHLFNGPLVNRRIADPQGRLARMLQAGKSPAEIVAAFYRLALARRPTAQEREFWRQQLSADDRGQQRQLLEDFLWSLLTCHEFVTNH